MSLKPVKRPAPSPGLKPAVPEGEESPYGFGFVDTAELEKRRKIAEINVLLRPWLFKKEIAETLKIPTADVNKIFKKLGIKKTVASMERAEKRRMKTDIIVAIRSALKEIDPKYRLLTLTRLDYLPRYMTGLTTDVRLTEAFGKLEMKRKLRDILEKNFESALKNDYVAWKRVFKYILARLEEGASEREILNEFENYELFEIDEDVVKKAKEVLKELGSASKFSVALTADERKWIRETAKELVETLPEEIKEIELCPAYTTNSKEHRGMIRMIADMNPDGSYKLFSRPVYNIPFLNYSPPKRVQIASHSIAKDRSQIEMVYGEPAKVRALYNDLDYKGVNAKMEVITDMNHPLFKKTYGGGIVITEGLARKLTHIWKSREAQAISMTPDGFLPEGTYVKKGDAVVKNPLEMLEYGEENIFSPYEGKIVWLGPPKKHTRKHGLVYYTRKYIIVREEPAKVGDKIMSRTGLRGVITDIIPGDEPKIYVNYTDVWKELPEDLRKKGEELVKKEMEGKRLTEEEKQILREYRKIINKRKAALLKENKAGGVFIYYEPDGLIGNYRGLGLSVSWTLLMGGLEKAPFERFWDNYIFPRKDLKLLFKVFHLKLEKTPDGKFRIVLDPNEPKPDKDGFVIPFEHQVAGRRYKYLYVPYKFQKLTVDNEGNIRRFGFYEDMSEIEKRFMWNKNYKTSLVRRLYDNMFQPRWGIALERKLVAADVPPDTVVISQRDADILGVKDGDLIGFRKEPVTSSNNLLTLKVKVDKTGKYTNVIGINPYIAERGNFDFDGDSASLIWPHPGEEFMPKVSEKELEPEPPPKELPSDEEVESMYMDDERLAREVQIYNRDTRAEDNEEIRITGAARKRAFAIYPDTPVDAGEINRLFDVEQVMKAKDVDFEKREAVRRVVLSLSRRRGKIVSLFMLMKDKRKFNRVMQLLVNAQLDPHYVLDRMIIWSIFGKAAANVLFRGWGVRELRAELKRVREMREHLEDRVKNSKYMSDQERQMFKRTIRDLREYEKELKRWIRLLKDKKKITVDEYLEKLFG